MPAVAAPAVEYRGMTLEAAVREVLHEKIAALGGDVYVKGFLRSYAEYLGLDGQLYVDEYNSRYVTRDEDGPLKPRRSTVGRRRNSRCGTLWPWTQAMPRPGTGSAILSTANSVPWKHSPHTSEQSRSTRCCSPPSGTLP